MTESMRIFWQLPDGSTAETVVLEPQRKGETKVEHRLRIIAKIAAESPQFQGASSYAIDGADYPNSFGSFDDLEIQRGKLVVSPERAKTRIVRELQRDAKQELHRTRDELEEVEDDPEALALVKAHRKKLRAFPVVVAERIEAMTAEELAQFKAELPKRETKAQA